MKLSPEKYKEIKKKWIENRFPSQGQDNSINYASQQQSKFLNKSQSKYYKYVPCPLCQEDKYKIFYKRTRFSEIKWKDFILVTFVRFLGHDITSSIFSILFRRPRDLSREGYSLVECSKCGFFYRNPIYRENTLKKAYDNIHYLNFLSGKYSETRIDMYKNILNELDFENRTSNFSRRRILDIGCGFGLFLNYIKLTHWEPYGLDFSSACIEYARKQFGLKNVQIGNIEENTFKDDFFDVVTLWSVAAHLIDPIDMFRKIQKVLRASGYLIINTVNAESLAHHYQLKNWSGFSTNHLVFFDCKTLTYALKKAGFISVNYSYDRRMFHQLTKAGTIPNKHVKYFDELMRKENLGNMLFAIATNG